MAAFNFQKLCSLESKLNESKSLVIKVDADGHCLVNSVCEALRFEKGIEITKDELLTKVKHEIETFSTEYSNFSTSSGDHSPAYTLKTEVDDYIKHGIFNTDSVDICISAICNALQITLIIWDEKDNGELSEITHTPSRTSESCPNEEGDHNNIRILRSIQNSSGRCIYHYDAIIYSTNKSTAVPRLKSTKQPAKQLNQSTLHDVFTKTSKSTGFKDVCATGDAIPENLSNDVNNIADVTGSIPSILDGKFFTIVSIKGETVQAKCKNCVNKTIRGTLVSTTNFLTHLRRQHAALVPEFNKHKSQAALLKRKKLVEGSTNSAEPQSKKAKSDIFTARQPVTQRKVDELVLNYIVGEMRPLVTVEKPKFVALVEGLAPKGLNVLSRKTLSSRIDINYNKMILNLQKSFREINNVCTTADIWSCLGKSYMGMTAHWIDSNDLSRKSVALACRRFTGSHTYDRIAELISRIHSDFGIPVQKITHTVTDNAANFSKAFLEFKDSELPANVQLETERVTKYSSNTQLSDEDESSENDDPNIDQVEVSAVGDALEQFYRDSDTDIFLPLHQRCCSHTFNLIATGATETACSDLKITTNLYKKLYRSSIAKCTALWNLVGRSTKACDIVRDLSDKQIIRPGATRWNAQYDAVRRIYDIRQKLDAICDALKLPKFQHNEIDFLREYISVMTPVSLALDILQGEKDCYFGIVLPTLLTVKKKLETLRTSGLIYATPLAISLLADLKKRFQNIIDINDGASWFVVASVSHPKFKLRCLPEENREGSKRLFIREVINMAASSSCNKTLDTVTSGRCASVSNDNPAQKSNSFDNFFEFEEQCNESITNENKIQLECISYLDDKESSIASLSKYENVKAVFNKFNCTLPSSAPVERLFSTAGQIETPRRNRLSDKHFEKLLLLKSNNIQ